MQLSLELPLTAKCSLAPTGEIHTKRCRKCGQIQPLEEFHLFSVPGSGRRNTCKSCGSELAKVRNRLRKLHPPPPPGICPICLTHTDAWVLDHNHLTDRFRGYICNSCNLGFGKFNDDPAVIKRAYFYLLDYTNATTAAN